MSSFTLSTYSYFIAWYDVKVALKNSEEWLQLVDWKIKHSRLNRAPLFSVPLGLTGFSSIETTRWCDRGSCMFVWCFLFYVLPAAPNMIHHCKSLQSLVFVTSCFSRQACQLCKTKVRDPELLTTGQKPGPTRPLCTVYRRLGDRTAAFDFAFMAAD